MSKRKTPFRGNQFSCRSVQLLSGIVKVFVSIRIYVRTVSVQAGRSGQQNSFWKSKILAASAAQAAVLHCMNECRPRGPASNLAGVGCTAACPAVTHRGENFNKRAVAPAREVQILLLGRTTPNSLALLIGHTADNRIVSGVVSTPQRWQRSDCDAITNLSLPAMRMIQGFVYLEAAGVSATIFVDLVMMHPIGRVRTEVPPFVGSPESLRSDSL